MDIGIVQNNHSPTFLLQTVNMSITYVSIEPREYIRLLSSISN